MIGGVAVAQIAGVSPKNKHVITATAAVKARTRQSKPRSRDTSAPLMLRKLTKTRVRTCATTIPEIAPIAANQQTLYHELLQEPGV